jgi:hypothetical protein
LEPVGCGHPGNPLNREIAPNSSKHDSKNPFTGFGSGPGWFQKRSSLPDNSITRASQLRWHLPVIPTTLAMRHITCIDRLIGINQFIHYLPEII